MAGATTILLRHVTGVEYRSPDWLASEGFLRVTVVGQEGGIGYGDAFTDEHTVLFNREQEPAFQRLREAIEDALDAEDRE